MPDNFKPNKPVTIWLYLGIFMVLTMVVIGGITRLTHSGLSMVHWSFTGSLPPLNESAWVAEFDRYQQSPEFKEVHTHFTLEEFQSIYWWEYIHRMFGRLIGIVFIFPFLFFLWKRRIPKSLMHHFLIILALGAFQALLGWFMVQSGLIDIPRVSHYRLAAHLTTAFITCAYIYWVTLQYRHHGRLVSVHSSHTRHVVVLGFLVLLQIIFGAFVAGLRAGWIHNTWPLMDGYLIAPSATVLEPLIRNFIEGRSGVQFVHRTIGIIIVLFSGYSMKQLANCPSRIKRSGHIAAGLIFLQFLFGVITLVAEVPIFMGIIHQVTALLLLLSIVHYYHSTRYSIQSNETDRSNG